MKVSKSGTGFRLLKLISGLVIFAGVWGMATGMYWGWIAVAFGIIGWIGFKIIDEVLNG